MKNLKLKVCGMRMASNIAAVADLKPDYLGFIFYEKSPRFISDVSAELIKYIPSEIKTVGVFVNEDLAKVKEKIKLHNLKVVQLHGSESLEYVNELKTTYTDLEIIKAFGIDEDFNFSKLAEYLETVDFFLFDTKTREHGGSGRIFNWQVLEKYTLNKPYFLSGGIDLKHASAIAEMEDSRLYALDINSKFEIEPGLKDVARINEFLKQIVK